MADFGRAIMSGFGGATSGASSGAAGGAAGAGIGAGVGGIMGFIADLQRQSDEAKARKKAREQYEAGRARELHRYQENERNKNFGEWEQRHAARVSAYTGKSLANDPMYQATHHDTYDPELTAAKFNANAPLPPSFDAEDPGMNWASLAQGLAQLGTTVGTLSRQDAAQEKLDELIQRRKNGDAQSQGNPWGGYASDPWSMY